MTLSERLLERKARAAIDHIGAGGADEVTALQRERREHAHE